MQIRFPEAWISSACGKFYSTAFRFTRSANWLRWLPFIKQRRAAYIENTVVLRALGLRGKRSPLRNLITPRVTRKNSYIGILIKFRIGKVLLPAPWRIFSPWNALDFNISSVSTETQSKFLPRIESIILIEPRSGKSQRYPYAIAPWRARYSKVFH